MPKSVELGMALEGFMKPLAPPDSGGRDGLYQDLILDHARHPRGYGVIPTDAKVRTSHSHLVNALCGDAVDIYLGVSPEKATESGLDLRFTSVGCLVCKASASILVCCLSGQPGEKGGGLAQALIDSFALRPVVSPEAAALLRGGDLEALLSLRSFPSRARCVTLAWEAYLASDLLKKEI